MLLDTPVPDEPNVWIGRTYADAPDIDGVVYVTGKDCRRGKSCLARSSPRANMIWSPPRSANRGRALKRDWLMNLGTMRHRVTTDIEAEKCVDSCEADRPSDCQRDGSADVMVLRHEANYVDQHRKTRPPLDAISARSSTCRISSRAIRLVLAIVLFWLIGYEHYLAGDVCVHRRGRHRLDRWLLCPALQPGDHAGPDSRSVRRQDHHLRHVHFSGGHRPTRKLTPWMAVVVVGRELLVTVLRSFLEQHGADFSATMSGKLKMVLQCVACAVSLFALLIVLAKPPVAAAGLGPDTLLIVSVWSAVVLTVISGVVYVFAAIKYALANRGLTRRHRAVISTDACRRCCRCRSAMKLVVSAIVADLRLAWSIWTFSIQRLASAAAVPTSLADRFLGAANDLVLVRVVRVLARLHRRRNVAHLYLRPPAMRKAPAAVLCRTALVELIGCRIGDHL